VEDGCGLAVRLLAPDARAQVSVATLSATPGTVTARAFVAAARGLSMDAFFDQALPDNNRAA
jgi:hypothetical protein